MHALLQPPERRDFSGAPRARGLDEHGREILTYLPGEVVSSRRPWPAWVHSDHALVDVAHWLCDLHAAVADFLPRERRRLARGWPVAAGLVAGHNDAW